MSVCCRLLGFSPRNTRPWVMILSIITINRNNAAGLEKTMTSVLAQTYTGFEYVVVDGASTDGSVDVIRRLAPQFGDRIKWVSEPDKGIYNAMNKGMRMATGDYFQILNSSDCLASHDVTGRMLTELQRHGYPGILYGNMVKCFPDGRKFVVRGSSGHPITMLDMYTGTVDHDPTYIRSDLFRKYGEYDERLKIVSDWKWFYKAIIEGREKPQYADIDVTLFDMTGISETNLSLRAEEKREALRELVNPAILADYDAWATSIDQMRRLKRSPIVYKIVWFLERCLFKMEKAKKNRDIRHDTKRYQQCC